MKKTYLTLLLIIMFSSLLAACVNDATPEQPQKTDVVNTAVVTTQPEETDIINTPSVTMQPQISEPAPSPAEWPEAYSAILEEYKMLADYLYRGIYDIVDDEEWQDQNIPILREEGIFWEPGIWSIPFLEDKDAYGYALKDINGDGSEELILLLKDYSVLAVFSTADGEPKLVDRYWNRYCCHAINESGLLYIYCFYDSAEDWYYAIQRLSDDGSGLLPIERYGIETYDYDTGERYAKSHYYKVTDGESYSEREIITEAEFDEFYETHTVFADWENSAEITKSAGITFIPILD